METFQYEQNVITERAEDKLFNFRPVFFAAVFFCAGIVFAYQERVRGVSSLWMLSLLPVALSPLFYCRLKKFVRAVLAAALLIASFFVGAFSFHAQIDGAEACRSYDGEYVVCGRVVNATLGEYAYILLLDDVFIGENEEEYKLVAYLPTSFFGDCEIGDEVVLTGRVQTRTLYDEEYGLDVYALGDGIRYKAQSEECVVIGHEFQPFAFLRARLHAAVYTGMDETPAAVTLAVLTGDTSGIDGGLLDNMRHGGIAHVFAVSGLHIGSLFAFCLLLVRKMKRKELRFAVTAGVLLFYGGVCGFSASVVRAVVTCLVCYGAALIGTESDFLNALGLAAVVVLALTPTALFEVGFQLSFAACLGIALLSRGFRKPLAPKKEAERPFNVLERARDKAASFLSLTLSAQLGTAPVTLAAFGYLSGWALLLNCLFVPLVSAVFALLLLFCVLASALPLAVSGVLLFPLNAVWSALLLAFETMDFSTFCLENVALTGGGIVFYYLALTFLSDKWNLSKAARRFSCAFCFSVFFATVLLANV